MLVSRWWLLGLLALVAAVSAAPQEDAHAGVWFEQNPEIDYEDYVNEDDMTDSDLDELADEIAQEIDLESEGDFARGAGGSALKIVGKGFVKGGKKVGSAIITAGKKVIKISGKGIKIIGKGAGKGLKVIGKGAGKGLIKIGKATGKGLIKGAKLAGKGVIKVSKATKKFATKKGTKIWASLKKQMNGEMGKAAKKLLKAVGKQVLEVGVSIAVEAVAPMIIEYVMQETQDKLCSCEAFTCSCCAQPPGFQKGCLVMRVRPKMKFINAAVTYDGKELARINITSEEAPQSCKQLGGLARFITACIEPLGMGELENGFRGCLTINLSPISIEREMCVDFTGTLKNGTATWVPVNELDEIELVIEEAEGDEE